MITLKCALCQAEFKRHPSSVKHNKNTFCSISCNRKFYGKTIIESRKKFDFKPLDKFKSLTLIQYTLKENRRFWECKCDCGNIITRREDYIQRLLKEDRTISCGCQNPIIQKGSEHKLWKGHGKLSAQYFQSIKCRAKQKELEFNVTLEYLWNLFLQQNEKCVLSGVKLTIAESQRTNEEMTASLDRIDSSKGYIEENVQWIHKDINTMKNTFSEEQFIEWCQLIVTHKTKSLL